MPFALQKSPLGLLGAFDLKTTGRAPDQFAETVTPVTDVTKFYAANLLRQDTNSSTGEVAPASVAIIVDPRFCWLVRNVSARFDFAVASNSADEQWRFTLQYIPAVGGAQFYLASQTLLTASLALPLGAAATFSVFLHATFPEGLFLLPGTTIEASCSATMSAGSYGISLRSDFAALQV